MRAGFRFAPPRVVAGSDTDWALLRAFGPIRASTSPQLDEVGVGPRVERALTLDLGERIRARYGGRLRAEIGPAVAALDSRFHACVARDLAVRRCLDDLMTAAAAVDVPIVFLKGTALSLSGLVQPGSRPAGDVDILVPSLDARPLRESLRRAGFAETETSHGGQHLAPLVHPLGVPVEIHHRLAGIQLARDVTTDGAACLRHTECRRVTSIGGTAYLPERAFMIAHCLSHGLAQHGFTPRYYSAFRMLADLQDLGFGGDEGDRFWTRGWPWVAHAVSREEVEAARGLLRRLEGGMPPSTLVGAAGGPGRLLRHMLAGIDDEQYCRTLDLRQQLAGDGGTGTRVARDLMRRLRRAVWPSGAWLAATYGAGTASPLVLRLTHPFHLVRRLWRALRAARRHRGTPRG